MPELRTIHDLKPAPYNPRTITTENARALATSLREFGDISGIVWNARTGHLVAGHQRLDTLKRQYGDTLEFEPVDTEAARIVTPDGHVFDVRIGLPDGTPEFRRMILSGHKLSSGMQQELDTLRAVPGYAVINGVGLNDNDLRALLREHARALR